MLFGSLAWLFMKPSLKDHSPAKARKIALLVVILTSLWGLATEYLQESLVSGRSFDLWDWVADTAGAIIAWIYFHLRLRKIKKANNA